MASGAKFVLAENATTGNGSAANWPGGKGLFMAEATWGGGSAKMQFQSPNGTWIDYPATALAANGAYAIDLPAGQIRAVIATATACYAYAVRTAT